MGSNQQGKQGERARAGTRALEAASAIEKKSDELIALTDQLIKAWNAAMPHLSRDEMEPLYQQHVALGRDVLLMATMLLGRMWLRPQTAATFTAIQANTATLEDFIENALSVTEGIARDAAEEA